MKGWHEILSDEITARNITSVANDLGYARTTISLVYHNRYPGDPHKIAARVLEVFSCEINCPHLKRKIAQAVCTEMRTAPMPTNNPAKFRHWTACQVCPMNPNMDNRGKKQ